VTTHQVPALTDRIEATLAAAIRRAAPEGGQPETLVRRSDFADYQSDAAFALAKNIGVPPRALAVNVIASIDESDLIAEATVAGPGFVNITVSDRAIWEQVAARASSRGLGVGTPLEGSVTAIDYSAPNVAKQMHVGHLRTTIIGDALARLNEVLGARVIRQNHLGDWGTQFGMLIQYLDEHPDAEWHHAGADAAANITALDGLYRAARSLFDADVEFAERSRSRVVALQTGDEATVAIWRDLVDVSMAAFNAIYARLGVSLTDDDIDAESSYNPMLDQLTSELIDAGVAVESEGAWCVFLDGHTGRDDQPVPMIVKKKDGGFGYSATDLATIRHRIEALKTDRILYVVDARQSLHFTQVFAVARKAGWLTDDIDVEHVAFGTILGADGKPFKTREGGTVPLTSLLDDAVNAARAVVAEKNPGLPSAELDAIAEAAGIGAVKYADLSVGRTTDYRFDPERMVSLTGNTGVYLQYAHARLASILRKTDGTIPDVHADVPISDTERALALHVDAYPAALVEAATLNEPHRIAGYLYQLAKTFSGFYENNPVLAADRQAERDNRLALVHATKTTLAHGLNLLGIVPLERI
jgi:arginyl-tRNA synthetase